MFNRCSNCNGLVSGRATLCPHCGEPRKPVEIMSRVENDKGDIALSLFLLVILLGTIAYVLLF